VTSAQCPQCSAVVEVPPERLATECPYCRANLVAAASQEQIPDLAAPFRLTREQASFRLRQHLSGHAWAPESVRRAGMPDAIAGLLLPFWVHSGVARSTWRAPIGLHYWVTVRSGGKTRRERRTEWFETEGSHVAEFAGELVSASKGLSEVEANALEPFDLGALRPFEPALVAGWIAELPTVDREDAALTAAEELQALEAARIRRFLPGDEVGQVDNSTHLDGVDVRLALLPAWMATLSHEGRALRFLVNGQTGEVVGKVPVSKTKVALCILAVLALPVGFFLARAIFS